ncbi:hypothetical protein ACWGJP_14640 [Microbacterium sp. NPDC055903]
MSTPQIPADATNAQPLTAPAGLNLLGDANAGSCCGGSCALPGQ